MLIKAVLLSTYNRLLLAAKRIPLLLMKISTIILTSIRRCHNVVVICKTKTILEQIYQLFHVKKDEDLWEALQQQLQYHQEHLSFHRHHHHIAKPAAMFTIQFQNYLR